jgi:hypothetical protein
MDLQLCTFPSFISNGRGPCDHEKILAPLLDIF